MPAVTLKGKTGAPTTRKDGSTVVVSKAVTAVLEERFPRTAMKGKQAGSVSAIELHAALKKERQTAQTLVSKQANEMMDTALAAQERKANAAVAAHDKKAEAKLKAALKETAAYMNKQATTAVAAEEKKAAAAIKTLKGKVAAKNKQTEAMKASKALDAAEHKKEMQGQIDAMSKLEQDFKELKLSQLTKSKDMDTQALPFETPRATRPQDLAYQQILNSSKKAKVME